MSDDKNVDRLRLPASYEHLTNNQYRTQRARYEASKWAEVDGLAEVVVVKNKLTDENFGALVPWDGVDPGPQAF